MSFTSTGSIAFGGSGARTLTLTGSNTGNNAFAPIIGDGTGGATSLIKSGAGTWVLSGANTYTGGTTINAGTLQAGSTTALGPAANATLTFGSGSTGKFQLNGNNTTIIDLNTNATVGSPIIESGSATAGTDTLTVNTTNNDIYAGVLQNGSTRLLALTKSGAGSLTLSGTNTYTGGTTINGGTLNVNNTSAIGTGTFTITGGTISNTSAAGITLTTNNPVIWGGDFTFGSGVNTNNLDFGTGAVTMPASRIISIGGNGNLLTFGGTVTNTSGADVTLTVNNVNFSGLSLGGLALSDSNAPHTVTIAGSGNVRISGVVANGGTGSGNLTYSGTTFGGLELSGANTYSGLTILNSGTLYVANDSAFGTSALSLRGGVIQNNGPGARMIANQVSLDGNVTVYGNQDMTFTGTWTDSGSRTLNNIISGTLTLAGSVFLSDDNTTTGRGLTISGYAPTTISGVIVNNNSGNTIAATLTYSGTGTLLLTGNNTYSGTTTINSGTLNAGATGALGGTPGITVNSGGTFLLSGSSTVTDRINNSATMTLNGGTFNTGGLQEHGATNNTAGVGALTLQSSSIIDMASGTSILAFANSSANSAAWGIGKSLDIWDWTGTPLTGGGTDQLYFGSDATGLTASQLLEIHFYTGAGTGLYGGPTLILVDGEVVPIPEPSTWLAAGLALSGLLFAQHQRLRRAISRR